MAGSSMWAARSQLTARGPSRALLGWIWPERRRRAAMAVLMRSHPSRFTAACSSDAGRQQQQQRSGAEAFPVLEPPCAAGPDAEDPFMELLLTLTFHVDGRLGKVRLACCTSERRAAIHDMQHQGDSAV